MADRQEDGSRLVVGLVGDGHTYAEANGRRAPSRTTPSCWTTWRAGTSQWDPPPQVSTSTSEADAGRGSRLGPLTSKPKTYQGAGVSLATAESIVERLRAAVESTGAERSAALPGSTRSTATVPRGVDGQRRLEADARAARRPPALGGDGPRGALHQRRALHRRRASVPARLRRRQPHRRGASCGARRGRRRGLPDSRLRAHRRRDGGAAWRSTRSRSSTSPERASGSSNAIA